MPNQELVETVILCDSTRSNIFISNLLFKSPQNFYYDAMQTLSDDIEFWNCSITDVSTFLYPSAPIFCGNDFLTIDIYD